ncbi:hypothetical protein B566_EDAN003573 [Ephemera danica]|nr:hypothetical protein B566_EDAN003573 [Ephemera danica]
MYVMCPRAIQQAANYATPPTTITGVVAPSADSSSIQPKRRVFTGTITKLLENFGFIDDDIFFQMNVCTKGLPPKVGERCLVDANYNSSMPFKWNASRVEVLPPEMPLPKRLHERSRVRDRRRSSRERDRDQDRDRRREERLREREREKEKEKRSRSPLSRRRSRSPRLKTSRSPPPRRRTRIVPKYMVQVPKISLNMADGNVMELKRRYNNLYIPSDYFCATFRWVDTFPADKPLKLNKPCSFHILPKSNETMAIGGPWSPSLDGPNPDKDPAILIRTAIRTCKALTGVDLSPCTSWYRFLDIHYYRGESNHKGKVIPSRVETVVIFLPDVWGVMPTRLEWDEMHLTFEEHYKVDETTSESVNTEYPNTTTSENSTGHVLSQLTCFYYCLMFDCCSQVTPAIDGNKKEKKVVEIRRELEARALNAKGLKSQMVARLAKVLRTEKELELETCLLLTDSDEAEERAEEAKLRQKTELSTSLDLNLPANVSKKMLPENPHILVYPSRTAKSGKFDCTVMSLSLLLDYRSEDTKEHSFEVSLFAELFNEMLMRDNGFRIYRALMNAPEKSKECQVAPETSNTEQEIVGKVDEKQEEPQEVKSTIKMEVLEETPMEVTEMTKASEQIKEEVLELDEDDESREGSASNASSASKKPDSDKPKDTSKEKDSKERKSDKKMLSTTDPALLMAFLYFDQTHCGYIFDKDLEEILYIEIQLGSELSLLASGNRVLFPIPMITHPPDSEAQSKVEGLTKSEEGLSEAEKESVHFLQGIVCLREKVETTLSKGTK